ncbi:LysR family transcriptional regulator [Thermoflavimicrobium daqui]|nr:LysR family transcriptional regulator [Thermoflavimicrobium daqui]
MFSLQQVIYFKTTIEKGSINKASKELFVSQPALTKQLTRLEQDLGTCLLIRKSTGVEPTEAGIYFYQRACIILEEIKQIMKEMGRFSFYSSLRIGTLPSLANDYLPSLMDRFINKPKNTEEINILIRDTTQELITLLEDRALEIAFVQDYDGHPIFKSLPLFQEQYFAILPTSHPLGQKQNLSFAEVIQEKMILHKEPCDIRTSFQKHCYHLGIKPNIILELNFNESLLPFVAEGYGISLIPEMSAKNIQDTKILVKKIDHQPFYRKISVVFSEQLESVVFRLLTGQHPIKHG